MFVTYLTIYNGKLLPKFYIGSTSLEKIKSGKYFGSVNSIRWGKIFKNELKNNINLFKIKILTNHKTREEALIQELLFQKNFDVVNSNSFFNEAFASVNGSHGRNVKGENNPRYGATITQETRKKIGQSNSISLKGKKKSEEHKKALKQHGKNKLPVRDQDGKQFLVYKDDPRYISGELISVTKGRVNVKDKDGNGFCVSKNDPRYLSGELKSVNLGRVVSDKTKEKLKEKLECPFCNTIMAKSAAKRYHFDKCKLNNK